MPEIKPIFLLFLANFKSDGPPTLTDRLIFFSIFLFIQTIPWRSPDQEDIFKFLKPLDIMHHALGIQTVCKGDAKQVSQEDFYFLNFYFLPLDISHTNECSRLQDTDSQFSPCPWIMQLWFTLGLGCPGCQSPLAWWSSHGVPSDQLPVPCMWL